MVLPGAFLYIKNDESVVMFMKGRVTELIVCIALQMYRKYFTKTKHGEKILYMRVQKALYGMLKSSLLFYRKLREDLKHQGLKVNKPL